MRVALILAVWEDMTMKGFASDLAASLRSSGVDFFVIARRAARGEPALSQEAEFAVHRVGWIAPVRGLSWLEAVVNLLAVPWQTRRILREQPHAAVHYHFSGVDWNYVALSAPFYTAPLLATFHGCLRPGGHPVWEMLCAAVVRRAARLSAVSRAVLADVSAGYPEAAGKITWIHNGVYLSAFRRGDADEARPARPYILSVARLAPYKGHDLLLFGFLDLVRRGSAVDLVICGPEQDGGHVRGLVEALGLRERVRLMGEVPRTEVARLLRGCEFAVLASRDGEAFPLANIEALAAGKAVVSTDKLGIPEALEHEVNALLFPPRDVDALRDAMGRLLEDRALRARLEAGAARSAEAFSREAMAEGYRRWYEEAR